ncbi:UNVERIFIED_CONTAM: hypothetical protein HDU68_009004 [Siphonaria sp. JEL0065]|nr:hypothetical protein HDU68_009004 [Siphonaria sp. JEL0065]
MHILRETSSAPTRRQDHVYTVAVAALADEQAADGDEVTAGTVQVGDGLDGQVHWRLVRQRVLTVSSGSSSGSSGFNEMHVAFNARVVGRPLVTRYGTQLIVALVVNRALVQLAVPLAASAWGSLGVSRLGLDKNTPSIPLHTNYARVYEIAALNLRNPTATSFPDLDTAVVGCDDGVVVVVDARKNGICCQILFGQLLTRYKITEYKEHALAEPPQRNLFTASSSFLATPLKFIPGWASAAPTPNTTTTDAPSEELNDDPAFQPVALTHIAHEGGLYVLAYCRDRNIRVFDLITYRHVKTVSTLASSAAAPNPNVNTIASSFSSFGIGGGSGSNNTATSSDFDRDNNLLSDLDPFLSLCNSIKVFGVKLLPDPSGSGSICQFKVAVYNHPNTNNTTAKSSSSDFLFFEGEISASGEKFLQIHLLGRKTGPALSPGSILKQFDIVPGTNAKRRSVTITDVRGNVVIEDEDNEMTGTVEAEWFQIWALSCFTASALLAQTSSSATSSSTADTTHAESKVYWGQVEIGAAEDSQGLRVRAPGPNSSTTGDRWSSAVPYPTPRQSYNKSQIPDLEYLLKTKPVEQVYADHIFESTYFSPQTIQLALGDYCARVRKENQFVDPAREFRELVGKSSSGGKASVTTFVEVLQLKPHVISILSKYLPASTSTSTPLDKKHIVLQRWQQFLKTCVEVDYQELVATGLSATTATSAFSSSPSSTPSLYIHRRGQIGVLRPLDPIEFLQVGFSSSGQSLETNLLPTRYFEQSLFLKDIVSIASLPSASSVSATKQQDPNAFRTAFPGYTAATTLLNRLFSSGGLKRGFLDAVAGNVVGKVVVGSILDAVLKPAFKGEYGVGVESVLRENRKDLLEAVRGVGSGNVVEFVESFVRVFEVASPAAAAGVKARRVVNGGGGEEGGLGDSLFVKAFKEVSEVRKSVVEDLVFFVAVLVKLGEGDKAGGVRVGKNLVAKIVGVYASSLVFAHVSSATVVVDGGKGDAIGGGGVDMMDIEGDGAVKVCLFYFRGGFIETLNKVAVSRQVPLPLFLYNAFCKESGGGVARLHVPSSLSSSRSSKGETVETRSAFLLDHTYAVLQSLGLYQKESSSTATPYINLKASSAFMATCRDLALSGQAETALQLLKFFPKDSYCLQYLEGFVKVKAGEFEGATGVLETAGNCFVGGLSKIQDEDWKLFLDDKVKVEGALGYFQHVMGLFQEAKAHKHVARFAKIALASMPENQKLEKKELSQSLWKTMFSHSLEAGEFEAAHIYLSENTDLEMRKICIRSFVTSLCQAHKIDDLCCRYTFGSLQSEVEETLLFQARARRVAPIPTRKDQEPNYHEILYAYYTYHGDNRNASAIMYDYARRLNSVSSLDIGGELLTTVITEQARAYLASLNSLSLVNVDYQWLLYRVGTGSVLDQIKKRRKIQPVVLESDYGSVAGATATTGGSKKQEIVHLSEIRKECALTLAKLNLAQRYRELATSAGLPDPDIAISLLIQDAQFDQSFKLARVFEIGFEQAFGAFGAYCVELEESERNSSSNESLSSLSKESVIEDAPVEWEGTNSQKAWKALKLRLDEQVALKNEHVSEYRKAIADRALEKSVDVSLPEWLIDGFLMEKPEDLVRIYLRHGLVEEAASFAVKFVENRVMALPEHGDRIKPSHSSKWLSFTVIDQVVAALDNAIDEADQEGDSEEVDTLDNIRSDLARCLYGYLAKTREDTIIFTSDTHVKGLTSMPETPLPEKISRKFEYRGKLGAPFKSSSAAVSGGSSILARVGPTTNGIASSGSILSRLGPSVTTSAAPEPVASSSGTSVVVSKFTTASAITNSAFSTNLSTPSKPFSSSTPMDTPPPQTSLFGGFGGGGGGSAKSTSLFGDLAAPTSFGFPSPIPAPSLNSTGTGGLTFGKGPGLSPDGPKPKPEGAKYERKDERKGKSAF